MEPFDTTNHFVKKKIQRYKSWQYKNTALLVLGVSLFFYFEESHVVQQFISQIGSWGYVGAFVTGVLLVSIFTAAPAVFILYVLATYLNPYEVALFAGTGSLLGDYLLLRFLKDKVFEELSPIFKFLGGTYLTRIFRTPYFMWIVPLIGAVLIAVPVVPDEAGIGILGLSKLKTWQFMLLSFLLNAIGIFIIVTMSQSV